MATTLSTAAQDPVATERNPDGTLTVIGRGAGATGRTLVIPDTIDGRLVTRIGDRAFSDCIRLTQITIPASVTSIGERTFDLCTGLTGMYFQGNAPSTHYFDGTHHLTIYHLPGTTGWRKNFAGRPTAPWLRPYPTLLDFGDAFGPSTNGFRFVISWATNMPVVVETSTDIGGQGWTPISTNSLTDGWVQFTDPEWASQPARFYRVREE